jgi:flagellar M-ring protein FliF
MRNVCPASDRKQTDVQQAGGQQSDIERSGGQQFSGMRPTLETVRALVAQLGSRRLLVMAAVAMALLVALAAVALRGTNPGMGFLYTDLDPAAAAAITEKLKTQDIPFQLSADGSSVLVPQDRIAGLRMGLAGEQLGGRIGYDVLDAEEPFGVSASRAKVNETRAIEGELARSVETLEAVLRARVQIVMPERAVFATEARKATAAVTLKTKGRLPGETVQAIRYLVAAAVPELSADSVTIIDQNGTLLARAGEAGAGAVADADERQVAVESRLRNQIEAMLEPIVGVGKVRAEVAAVIGRDQIREDTNVFDPDAQVIARQVTVESADQNNEGQAAPRGASVGAQLPEAAEQAAGAGGGNSRQSDKKDNSEDTTYSNSATRTVTVKGPGKVTRLTVAVMIDGGPKGLPAPQLQKLTRIVENAVGFDADRGDSVVVEPMRFAAADALAAAEPGWLSMVSMDQVYGLLKLALIAVVGLIALRMLRGRPGSEGDMPGLETSNLALAAADSDAPPADGAMPLLTAREGSDAALLDQEIALAQVDGRIKLSALKRIGDAVAANPAESAAVVRQWMNA